MIFRVKKCSFVAYLEGLSERVNELPAPVLSGLLLHTPFGAHV